MLYPDPRHAINAAREEGPRRVSFRSLVKDLARLDEKKPLGGLTQSAKPRWEFLAHSQSPRIQLIAVPALRKISGSGEARTRDLLRDRQQVRVDEKLPGYPGDGVIRRVRGGGSAAHSATHGFGTALG